MVFTSTPTAPQVKSLRDGRATGPRFHNMDDLDVVSALADGINQQEFACETKERVIGKPQALNCEFDNGLEFS